MNYIKRFNESNLEKAIKWNDEYVQDISDMLLELEDKGFGIVKGQEMCDYVILIINDDIKGVVEWIKYYCKINK